MLPLKYLKSSCARNFQIILVIDFQNYSVVFERDLVRNIVFSMRYKWMKAVDSNKVLGAIPSNLSKAFDCVCHDFLVAKLYAHGLSPPDMKMVEDYLLNSFMTEAVIK